MCRDARLPRLCTESALEMPAKHVERDARDTLHLVDTRRRSGQRFCREIGCKDSDAAMLRRFERVEQRDGNRYWLFTGRTGRAPDPDGPVRELRRDCRTQKVEVLRFAEEAR